AAAASPGSTSATSARCRALSLRSRTAAFTPTRRARTRSATGWTSPLDANADRRADQHEVARLGVRAVVRHHRDPVEEASAARPLADRGVLRPLVDRLREDALARPGRRKRAAVIAARPNDSVRNHCSTWIARS